MAYPAADQMVYKGFYNYCPPWIDSSGVNHTAFFCRMHIKKYGLQYVFCCSNQTHRYFCCQDPDKYYLHVEDGAPEPTLAHLLLLQFWPMAVMIGLAVVFAFMILCGPELRTGPAQTAEKS